MAMARSPTSGSSAPIPSMSLRYDAEACAETDRTEKTLAFHSPHLRGLLSGGRQPPAEPGVQKTLPVEVEGFEPSVPRKRDDALRDCPFRFSRQLLDRPTFGLETCAT